MSITKKKLPYSLAIVGATGMVGKRLLNILEERYTAIKEIHPFDSGRVQGQKVHFHDREIKVKSIQEADFKKIDFVLFSAGGNVSAQWAPQATAAGAIVIDNTSFFRMDPSVPLIIPEINGHLLKDFPSGIIANPNCSTIQLLMALYPLHHYAKAKRIVVSTYQSVSGAGQEALFELERQTKAILTNSPVPTEHFPKKIAFNVLPHIDHMQEDGFTKEEWKMMVETQKILESSIKVVATCVRVPVFIGHSVSAVIEFENPLSVAKAKELMRKMPGLSVATDKEDYFTPLECSNEDIVYVSRVRKDPTVENGLAVWIVADNLRKGAALNAIQIMEKVISYNKKGKSSS